MTWWVDDVEMMELDRRAESRKPPDLGTWNDQMHHVHFFQELVSNSDFNQGNLLITKDWRVWLVDFTRAFRGYRKLQNPERLRRIDRRVFDALQDLDEATLRAEMGGLLDKYQIRGLLARRDLIVLAFEARIEERGVEAVLR